MNTLTFVTHTCTCCETPQTLVPRDDLAPGLAVCEQTGQLYQPQNNTYVPTSLPNLAPVNRPATDVQIDLSRSSYA